MKFLHEAGFFGVGLLDHGNHFNLFSQRGVTGERVKVFVSMMMTTMMTTMIS